MFSSTDLPGINSSLIESQLPLLIVAKVEAFNPLEWVKENMGTIDGLISKHGGVVLRRFNISSVSEFNRFVGILSVDLLDYVYRSTPRTRLGGKIYTATEYPSNRIIPLHNENSYSKSWPNRIIFFSAVVAASGGRTPICDSRNIFQKIAPEIRDKFEQKGVMYVRNYTQGLDLSWQEVFQTDKKDVVEDFCNKNDIEFQWGVGNTELTTRQVCQATVVHPLTGEKVWFNQAHLFHVSSLQNNDSTLLTSEVGESNLPRNAFYGDGSSIEEDVLDHIRKVYDSEKISFPWQRNDIMILDNLLMAHGRDTFEGERKIAVAMY